MGRRSRSTSSTSSQAQLLASKEEQLGLLADIGRIRDGDQIIFYMERVGFFGLFTAADDALNAEFGGYLLPELERKLIYRVRIVPSTVFPRGVTESEALDFLPRWLVTCSGA